MWARIWLWLSSFWKAAEEVDPFEEEPEWIPEEPLDSNFQKLPTHNLHLVEADAFTQFSGFHVPWSYGRRNLVKDVMKTRAHCSIHDASYKRQFLLIGIDSSRFLDPLVTSDIVDLKEWTSVETLMTNNNGGIIDILIVSKKSKRELHIVANTAKVLNEVQNHLKEFYGSVRVVIPKEEIYFIFQGPKCATYLENFFRGIKTLPSMSCKHFLPANSASSNYFNGFVIRNMDTEEDGYSISPDCHGDIETEFMPLIGLEARECLRIEAGKCLPGKDIDEETTPVEAELMHLISERKMRDGSFPGSERILKELRDNNPSKRRRGFISKEGRLRSGDSITLPNGQQIGYVTSGTYSPVLRSFIAMGYVDTTYSNKNDVLMFDGKIKGRFHKLPFVNKGEPR